MSNANNMKTITTDVLSIGGGGAGIMAAISARNAGAQVLLVSKGKIGNSGNTIMIGGSYSMDGESAHNDYGVKNADRSFTKKFLFEQIVKQSFFLSEQPLVRQFVEESPALVHACHEWGNRAGQKQVFTKPASRMLSGHALGAALKQGLAETPGIGTMVSQWHIARARNWPIWNSCFLFRPPLSLKTARARSCLICSTPSICPSIQSTAKE